MLADNSPPNILFQRSVQIPPQHERACGCRGGFDVWLRELHSVLREPGNRRCGMSAWDVPISSTWSYPTRSKGSTEHGLHA